MTFSTRPHHFVAFVSLVALAACGGSGSGGSSFSSIESRAETLAQKLDRADPTPMADLPSGSSTYDGVFGIILDTDRPDGVLGDARIDVNFRSNTFSGKADNFYNLSQQRASGSVTISDGRFDGDEEVIGIAEVSGSAQFESGRRTIDGIAVATFAGDDGELMTGIVGGDATRSGASAVGFEGVWIVED